MHLTRARKTDFERDGRNANWTASVAMGYRSFTDSKGISWQAWDVVPRLAERRTLVRRVPAAQPADSERRNRVERRVVAGVRPVLIAGLQGGWLCFEAPEEKRRLSPIPTDWLECAKETLENYLGAARRTVRPSAMVSA